MNSQKIAGVSNLRVEGFVVEVDGFKGDESDEGDKVILGVFLDCMKPCLEEHEPSVEEPAIFGSLSVDLLLGNHHATRRQRPCTLYTNVPSS